MKEYKGKQKTAQSLMKGGSCYAKGGKVRKPKEGSKKEEAGESASEEKQEQKAEKEVGKVKGGGFKPRLDKLKRGGKAGKKGKTQVNVMVAPGEKKVPVPLPLPPSAPMGGAAPGLPPGLPPGPGAMPPMGAKKGGKIKKRASGGKVPSMPGGSGGGLGRLKKSKDAAKK